MELVLRAFCWVWNISRSNHVTCALTCTVLIVILCQIVIIVFVGIAGDPLSRSWTDGLFACCTTTALLGLNLLVNAVCMAGVNTRLPLLHKVVFAP